MDPRQRSCCAVSTSICITRRESSLGGGGTPQPSVSLSDDPSMNLAVEAVGQGAMSLSSFLRRATNLFGYGGGSGASKAPALDGEIIYCKNNVCVHPPAGMNKSTTHHPGYLNVRSQDDEVRRMGVIIFGLPFQSIGGDQILGPSMYCIGRPYLSRCVVFHASWVKLRRLRRPRQSLFKKRSFYALCTISMHFALSRWYNLQSCLTLSGHRSECSLFILLTYRLRILIDVFNSFYTPCQLSNIESFSCHCGRYSVPR